MTPDTLFTLYKQIAALGVPAVLVIAFYGSYRGWWFWARDIAEKNAQIAKLQAENDSLRERYRMLDEEKNRYAMIAFANERLAQRSVTVAKRVVRGA